MLLNGQRWPVSILTFLFSLVWRAGNVHTSDDDVESDEPSSTDEESSTGEDSSHETDTNEGQIVLGSCDSFDAIPYPLSEDMEVRYLPALFGLAFVSNQILGV